MSSAGTGATWIRRDAATRVPAPRLAIFVHGLCETDDAWRLARRPPRAVRRPARVRARLHVAVRPLQQRPAHLRQRPAARRAARCAGRRLAGAGFRDRADRPLDGRAGRPQRLPLRRAAMGGRRNVRHVFTLGTPHRGAPLEQAANVACSALSLLPETRGFATPLKVRSAGIKDLRYGYLLDEDWRDSTPMRSCGTPAARSRSSRPPTTISSAPPLAADPDAPLSRIVGDLLVLRSSAWSHGSRGERMTVPGRSLPPRWRRDALRSAQPPGDLRPARESLAVTPALPATV